MECSPASVGVPVSARLTGSKERPSGGDGERLYVNPPAPPAASGSVCVPMSCPLVKKYSLGTVGK